MSALRTSSAGACTGTSRPRRNAGRRISPPCCSCRVSAPGRCARWPRWPKSSTARPIASAIPRDFRLPPPPPPPPHGGKDRHPYPVPLKVYDHTITVLRTAVQKAKLGQTEELAAIKRLDEQARRLERHTMGPLG